MANSHPANLGDVLKHLVLCEVLEELQPQRYLESHGGRFTYDLNGVETGPAGIWWFSRVAETVPALGHSAFARTVVATTGTRALPGEYFGSVAQADCLLHADAEIVVGEISDASAATLRRALAASGRRTRVVVGDGLKLVSDLASETDVVLIDPFDVHGAMGDGPSSRAAFTDAARAGASTFLWYAITKPRQQLGWVQDLWDACPHGLWHAEVRAPRRSAGLNGCGIIGANVGPALQARLTWLATALFDALSDSTRGYRAAIWPDPAGQRPGTWPPYGAGRARAAELRALVARTGFPFAVTETSGDWVARAAEPEDCSVHRDDDGTLRLVIDHRTDHPWTLRAAHVSGNTVITEDGEILQIINFRGGDV